MTTSLMRATWYEHRGPARDVLVVGELPVPEPGPGEIRIRVRFSGISPGDVKKRSGWQGAPMPYPRVIPHSDGAGIVDAVGSGVSDHRVGDLVWCYGAQSYRPFGTAAQYCVVPAGLAVALPADTPDAVVEQAAAVGIPGITGYRAVYADGPVDGLTVLVHGAAGGVGAIAAQLAVRGGARVIGLVRKPEQVERVGRLGLHEVLTTEGSVDELAASIRDLAPDGVHRIAEVDLAAHADLDAKVIAVGATVSSYSSSDDRTTIPYWQFGFADATLRLLGSDDFPANVKLDAARQLTAALRDGSLRLDIDHRLGLEEIAQAHELVERGAGRCLLTLA